MASYIFRPGVHAEGGIWSTLFGLLMWDVLFSPVPDVFRTPFQTAPLDLSCPSFYPARRQVIEDTLSRIRSGAAPTMLQQRWDLSYNTMCAGVNWQRNGQPFPFCDFKLPRKVLGSIVSAHLCSYCDKQAVEFDVAMPKGLFSKE